MAEGENTARSKENRTPFVNVATQLGAADKTSHPTGLRGGPGHHASQSFPGGQCAARLSPAPGAGAGKRVRQGLTYTMPA